MHSVRRDDAHLRGAHSHVVDEGVAHLLNELDGRSLSRLLVSLRLGTDVGVGAVEALLSDVDSREEGRESSQFPHVLLQSAMRVIVVGRLESFREPSWLAVWDR
jgi:hypothetical protein